MPSPESPQMNSGLYAPRRRLGHRDGRGVAEAVGRPDHESVEDVLLVEPRLGAVRRRRWTASPGRAGGRGAVGRPVRTGAAGRPSGAAATGGPARARRRSSAPRAGVGRCRRERPRTSPRPRGSRAGPPGVGPLPGRRCRHAVAERSRRVGHVRAARGGVDVDDDGQVDREAQVPAQRVADRSAQDPLDRVLGELARGGEQRGAVDQAEGAGEPQERALLRRQRRDAGPGGRAGQVGDHPVPHVGEVAGLVDHVRTPFGVSADSL